MSKDRVLTSIGPFPHTITGTTGTVVGSTWFRVGPFRGNQGSYRAVFSATSAGSTNQSVKWRGLLSFTVPATSADTPVDLAQRQPAQSGTAVGSTTTGVFNWLQIRSSNNNDGATIVSNFASLA